MSTVAKKRYTGEGATGMCVCGHRWDDHHLGVVLNQDYLSATNEAYIPQECEYYGFNEMGGMGPHGEPHCNRYQDSGLAVDK